VTDTTSEQSPPRSQVQPITIWTVAIHVGAIVTVLTIARLAAGVISWIVVALFLALALEPIVRFLEGRHFRRGLAVLATLLATAGVLAVMLGTLVPMFVEQGTALVASAPELLDRLRSSEAVRWADSRYGIVRRVQEELTARAGAAAGPLFKVVGSIVHAMAATITILVLAAFMLMFGGGVFRSLLSWLPPVRRERVRQTAERIRNKVGAYVSGTVLIASIGGAVTSILLVSLGVSYFLPLGLTMALLGVIPFIGALLGGALVVGSTFLLEGTTRGLVALAVMILYQQVENHLLQPLIQRKTIHMNPLVIAVVMLIGTAAGGIFGALVALPLAAALEIVLQDLGAQRRARWGEPVSAPSVEPELQAQAAGQWRGAARRLYGALRGKPAEEG